MNGHCADIDLSPKGSLPFMPPYGLGGTVQNKAADASMVAKMTFNASAGHSCGIDFKAADHLKAHPEFTWQKQLLRDMNSHPWATFTAGGK